MPPSPRPRPGIAWLRPARPALRGLAAGTAVAAMVALAPSAPALAAPRPDRSRAAAGAVHAPRSARPARPAYPVRPAAIAAPPQVNVNGGDLVNAVTGKRLWSTDPTVRRPMASITKVMTALLVLRAGHLDRKITVTPAAVQYVIEHGASNAGLIAGDVLTARQLLEALLVPSGCDAAYLLAAAYGPGRAKFVRKMNATARRLGLTSTHFSNFDGLPYPTEYATYSTPASLVRLGELAMRYRLFRDIVARRRYYLAATSAHHAYLWQTTDLLLGSYRGLIGIKTGQTSAAGDCFLFEARRGSRVLIGVVLHANPADNLSSRFTAARRLLNWGFRRLR